MITKSCLNFITIAATFIFLIYTVDDASALRRGDIRDGGSEPYAVGGQHTGGSQAYEGQPYAGGIRIARKGGGGRGGGGAKRSGGGSRGGAKRSGGGYSRSGSAKSGSFSSGSKHAQPTRSKRPAASAPKTASRSGTKQNRKQNPKNKNAEDRQEGRTDRTEARQDGATDRAQGRQQAAQSAAYYRSANNAYYYNNGHHHHDDWDDGEVAAVALGAAAVGYMVGQSSAENTAPSNTVVYSASPSGNGGLPCNPNTAVVNKVTYYQCGNDWYIQAYGESGVIYMPVPAPY
jgi:hypothetical protein